jgi:transposase
VTSMDPKARRRRVVIGVDTHKFVHVAVALDELGTLLGNTALPADRPGYERLLDWATSQGRVLAFGIEGTGSYGAAFASLVSSPVILASPRAAGRRGRIALRTTQDWQGSDATGRLRGTYGGGEDAGPSARLPKLVSGRKVARRPASTPSRSLAGVFPLGEP